MRVDKLKRVDSKVLSTLVPVNGLAPQQINDIANKTVVEEVRAGRYLFKKGDKDNQTIYLLSGKVDLIGDDNKTVDSIVSGSPAARHPLAPQQPRQVSARAKTAVTIARVDSTLLDVLLTWNESSTYEVEELDTEDAGDWMTRLLQSKAFLKVPPSNIQQILMRMEQVEFNAGDVVIREGDEGDYYYIITHGRCGVSRHEKGGEAKLAELSDGDSFGEEALLSDAKRNASVTMLTAGTLMRLSKKDFLDLLKVPLVHHISYAEAKASSAEKVTWLDVRLPPEYANGHIKGGVNIPLSSLRARLGELDEQGRYIVYCDSGSRGASAAFLLSREGFDVSALKDGLMNVPAEELEKGGAPEAAEAGAEIIPFDAERAVSHKKEEVSAEAVAAFPEAARKQIELVKQRAEEQVAKIKRQAQVFAKNIERQAAETSSKAEQRIGELEGELEQLRNDLAKQRKASESSVEKTAKAADELKARLDEAEQQVKESAKSLKKADQARETAEAERQKAAQELTTVQDELAKLRTSMAKGDKASEESAKRLNELDGENAKLRRDVEKLTADLKAAEESGQSAGAELEDLRKQLLAAGEKQQAAEAEAEKLRAERAGDQDGMEALNRELDDLRQQLQEKDAAHQTAVSEAQALRDQLSAAESRVEEAAGGLQAEIERLQTELATSKEQAEARDHALEELRKQANDSETARQTLASEAQSLREQLSAREREVEETAGGLKQELAALKDELARSQEQLGVAEGKQREAEQALAAAQAEMADGGKALEEARAAHERELQEAREKAAAAEAQFEAQNKALAEKDEALSKLQADLTKAERRIGDLQSDVSDFTKRLESVRKEGGSEAQSRLVELRAEVDFLKGKLAQTDAQRRELEKSLADAEDTLNVLRDTEGKRTAALEEEFAGLKKRLESAEQRAREAESRQGENLDAVREEAHAEASKAFQAQLEKLEQDLASSRGKSEEEVSNLRKELAGLNEDLAQAHTDTNEIQKARDAAEEELDRVRSQIRALEGLAADLEEVEPVEAIKALEERLERAAREANEAELRRAELENGRVHLQDRIKELEQQLADTQERAEQEARLRREAEEETAVMRQAAPEESAAPAPAEAGVDEEFAVTMPDFEELFPEVKKKPAAAEAAQASSAAPAYTPPLQKQEAPPRRSGGLIAVVASVLVTAALAGGGVYFMMRPQAPSGESAELAAPEPAGKPAIEVTEVAEAPAPEAVTQPAEEKPQPAAKPVEKPAPVKPAAEPVVAEAPKKAPPVNPLRSFRDNRGSPLMLELSGGSFLMGSSAGSQYFDERPQHEVRIKGFSISKNEITFAEYDRFAAATGRQKPDDRGWGRGNRPVIDVSWDDAVAYTEWLSRQTGHRYRLPTEAEWEYAARAGAETYYWWGVAAGQGHANCFNCGSEWDSVRTAPVGRFNANPYGLNDTSGNVEEWVLDCFHPNYKGAPSTGEVWAGGDCSKHMARGGSYLTTGQDLRINRRASYSTGTRLDTLGFRVVREH